VGVATGVEAGILAGQDAPMILVGQYDSPFVRRVAISLKVLGFGYEHDTRSVFGDFDSMRKTNPLGRIPSLVLDSGEVLIDSAAILDYLDELVGAERALIPRSGPARRDALQLIALASGAIEKIGGATYERLVRPSALRWGDWIERCLTQGMGGVEALDRQIRVDAPIDQVQITTGCLLGYIRLNNPGLMPAGRFPTLEKLLAKLDRLPAFAETESHEYKVPRAD
jgi:glutathione S-transferase